LFRTCVFTNLTIGAGIEDMKGLVGKVEFILKQSIGNVHASTGIVGQKPKSFTRWTTGHKTPMFKETAPALETSVNVRMKVF
jgi:hypothetical protein